MRDGCPSVDHLPPLFMGLRPFVIACLHVNKVIFAFAVRRKMKSVVEPLDIVNCTRVAISTLRAQTFHGRWPRNAALRLKSSMQSLSAVDTCRNMQKKQHFLFWLVLDT